MTKREMFCEKDCSVEKSPGIEVVEIGRKHIYNRNRVKALPI